MAYEFQQNVALQTLREEVEKYAPRDGIEMDHRARILHLLSTTQRPIDRNQFAPGHITGSAFLVSRDRGNVLLILHGKFRRWMQPGGHGEPGETLACDIARREALEEVSGIEIGENAGTLFDVDVHGIPARGEQPAHEHFDLRYLFEIKPGVVGPGSDAADARWFSVAEARGLDLDPGVRRMIEKACGAS